MKTTIASFCTMLLCLGMFAQSSGSGKQYKRPETLFYLAVSNSKALQLTQSQNDSIMANGKLVVQKCKQDSGNGYLLFVEPGI